MQSSSTNFPIGKRNFGMKLIRLNNNPFFSRVHDIRNIDLKTISTNEAIFSCRIKSWKTSNSREIRYLSPGKNKKLKIFSRNWFARELAIVSRIGEKKRPSIVAKHARNFNLECARVPVSRSKTRGVPFTVWKESHGHRLSPLRALRPRSRRDTPRNDGTANNSNVRNGKGYFRLRSCVRTIIQDRDTLETVNRLDVTSIQSLYLDRSNTKLALRIERSTRAIFK